MSTSTTSRRQNINVRQGADDPSQMEMPTGEPAFREDFDGQLANAQTQLEMLQAQRRELERQKIALEDLNQRKQEFLNGQLDLTEKFSSAVTTIERELFESKQEMEDLEQTRAAFANHLQRIESMNPEAWPKDSLNNELEKALLALDKADDEYEQAVAYFTGTRKRGLLGGNSARPSRDDDFQSQLRNGFAFNLPILILGVIALIVYLFN